MTEQEKREKVIDALEYCKDRVDGSCVSCHYPGLECGVDVAIAMLEAQEARVMTLEEVKANDWDYCYLEEERLPGKEYRLICGKHLLTCVTWPSITAAKITHGEDGYGKTWRCWTSRPDEKTREAQAWQ